MNDKARAKMLFNMHLGIKDIFKPKKSPGYEFYKSQQFVDSMQYLGSIDMDEGDRIAYAYPHYEFVVQFKNGDIVVFHTEGRGFQVSRIMGTVERAQFLYDTAPERVEQNMETYWEQMNRVIFIPHTEMVWGAPL